MVAGNPFIRNFTGPFPDVETSNADVWTQDETKLASTEQQFFLLQRAIGFNCMHYDRPAEPSLFRHTMPNKDFIDSECTDGLRLELAFPSCSTGDTDSPDHQDHMAYPSLVQQGVCPKGYPVLLPLLFFETIYQTNVFRGMPGEFVLSHGDPVGTGYHGDFMMGWESENVLENAMDQCRSTTGEVEACAVFDLQTEEEQMACRFPMPSPLRREDAVGPRSGLAGGVTVQYGPAQATP